MATITVQATITAPIQKVWEFYTQPEHVVKWNNASPDWHTPSAKNDLRTGGKFSYRMEAKDKSAGFDFEGTYTEVTPNRSFAYTMSDNRKVQVVFQENGKNTDVKVTFDPENENSLEMQREGWQSILDNFKRYTQAQK